MKEKAIKKLNELNFNVLNIHDNYISFTDGIYKYHLTYESIRKLNSNPHPLKSSNPYYIENVGTWLKINSIKLQVIGFASKNKLLYRCECGKTFERSFDAIKSKHRYTCTQCSMVSTVGKLKKEEQHLIGVIQEKGFSTNDRYVNCKTKMDFTDKQGYKYYLTMESVLQDNIPRKWIKSNPHSIHNIKKYIENNNLKCDILSTEYIKCNEKLQFRCECGNIFLCSIDHFIQGQNRCDKCSKNISSLELKTEEWLKKHGIPYEKEKTFGRFNGNKKPYRYDFYIPTKNMVIELHGRQHYEFTRLWHKTEDRFRKMQERDKIKKQFILERGITFLEIPYNKFSRNEEYKEILHSNLIGK